MTTLLQQAFDEAARLPDAEQNLLAARLLVEVAAEDDFDRKIMATASQLAKLSEAALAEYEAGETMPLDEATR